MNTQKTLRQLTAFAMAVLMTVTVLGGICVPTSANDNTITDGTLSPQTQESGKELVSDDKTVGLAGTAQDGKEPLTGYARIEQDLASEVYDQHFKADDAVTAIVVLKGDGLLEKGYDSSELTTSWLASMEQNLLVWKQNRFCKRVEKEVLSGSTLQVLYQYTVGLNGIAIRTAYGNLSKIAKMSGIETVFVAPVYTQPETATASGMIGTQLTWEKTGYTGKGMRIAVIDTGLELTHPNFQSDGFETTDTSLTTDGIEQVLGSLNVTRRKAGTTAAELYRSKKIPFAFNYIDRSLRVDHKDANGSDHGTHVAGIAAANKVEGSSVQGIAPDAQVLVMKVFGENGGAYLSDMLAAMEDAILLDVDAINLSVGSPAGFYQDNDTCQEIFNRFMETDITITVSGGNNYSSTYSNSDGLGNNLGLAKNPDIGVVGSPSAYAGSTSVASLENAAYSFAVGGKNITFKDTATVDDTDFVVQLGLGNRYEFAVIDGYGETLDQFTNADVKGKIAVVPRGGGVTFVQKQSYAGLAGAVACVVYNNAPGTTSMQIESGAGKIPCVSVSLSDGLYLKEQAENGVTTLQMNAEKTYDDITMSGFSSWGSTPSLEIKPEITGVGGGIYSTTSVDGLYGNMSGTSMSAPQVCGVATLVMQHINKTYPDLTAPQKRQLCNNLMLSTAIPYMEKMMEDGTGVEYSPRKQGSGVVNVYNAIFTQAVLQVKEASEGRPKAELGDDKQKTGVYTFSFDVINRTADSLAYQLDASVLTDTTAPLDDENPDLLVMQQQAQKLGDSKVSYASDNMGLYYDANDDGVADTRDAYDMLTAKGYSSRQNKLCDVNGDDVKNEEDIYAYLTAVAELESDVDLDKEALIVPAAGDEKGTATVTVTVSLTAKDKAMLDEQFENGIFVDGFVYCDSQNDDDISLSLPFLAYYGDWTKPDAFDADDHYYDTSDVVNTLPTKIYTDGAMLGVNPYLETEFDNAHMAVSYDNFIKEIDFGLLRNLKSLELKFTGEDGKVYYSNTDEYVEKSFFATGNNQFATWYTKKMWDGLDENRKRLPDNTKLKMQFVATLPYEDAVQTKDYAITLDNAAPSLVSYSGENNALGRTMLKMNLQDNHYIAAVIFTNAQGTVEYARHAVNQSAAGELLKDVTFDVTGYGSDFRVVLCDYAMNEADYDIELNLGTNGFTEPVALEKDRIYGFNSFDADDRNAGFVSAPIADLADSKNDTVQSLNLYAAEYVDGFVFAVNMLNEFEVYIPTASVWNEIKVAKLPLVIYDMAYDDAAGKMYAIGYDLTDLWLVTIDLYTGAMTKVAKTDAELMTLCCDNAGQLYGIDKDGNLKKVDKQTGETVAVGVVNEKSDPDWVTLSNLQSMTVDHNTGKAYWYVFSRNQTTKKAISRLVEVNLTNAVTTPVGEYATGCEIVGLFVPWDDTTEITATDEVQGVVLDQNAIAIYPGKSQKLFATVTPWNSTAKELEWSVDHQDIITQTSGRVTAKTNGTATVTVKVKGTQLSDQCAVKVLPTPDTLHGYLLFDMYNSKQFKFISFEADAPKSYEVNAELFEYIYAGAYVNGWYYCYDRSGNFYKVDPDDYSYVQLGQIGDRMYEMTYDYVDGVMYGLMLSGHTTALVTIDLHNGQITQIGSQATTTVALASVPNADFTASKLYAVDQAGTLITLNKQTGAQVAVANSADYHLPAAGYVQSMAYDYNTGMLYWAHIYSSQNLYLYAIDLDAGTSYNLGKIGKGGCQVTGLYIVPKAGNVPELPYVSLTDITLNSGDLTMVVDAKKQLNAVTVPANATADGFVWSSADSSVADVDDYGNLTAVAPGTTTITCKILEPATGQYLTKSIRVRVVAAAAGIHGFLVLDIDSNGSNSWISFAAADPSAYQNAGPAGFTANGGAYFGGNLYCYDNNEATSFGVYNFYRVNPKTLQKTLLGKTTTEMTDMTYDYAGSRMLGISNRSDIVMIDLATGETQSLLSQRDWAFVTLAAAQDGTLYSVARKTSETTGTGYLCKIDLAAGTVTQIGATGKKAVLSQSMLYDDASGMLYWAQISGSTDAALCLVDPTTGETTPIGMVGVAGSQVTTLYQIPDQEPTAPYVPATDLVMKTPHALVAVGKTNRLQATTLPLNATGKQFTWTSKDESIAVVDENGTITGVKAGTVQIETAYTENGKQLTAVAQVRVVDPAQKLGAVMLTDRNDTTLANAAVTMNGSSLPAYDKKGALATAWNAGTYYQGKLYGYDSANDFYEYDLGEKKATKLGTGSDRLSDMTVDCNKGVFYGVIYSKNILVQINAKTGSWYPVGVLNEAGTRVSINTIAAGKDGTLYGMTLGGDLYQIAADASVTKLGNVGQKSAVNFACSLAYDFDADLLYWTQIGKDVQNLCVIDPATCCSALLGGVGQSGSVLTALYVDSANVPQAGSVNPEKVVLSQTGGMVQVGSLVRLSATVLPVSVHYSQLVLWESSNEAVAKVNDNGVVTGVAKGSCVIKAISTADESVFAEYNLQVVGAMMYGYDTTNKAWVSFDPENPAELTKLADGDAVTCADYADGKVYAFANSGKQLISMDFKNGDFTYEKIGAVASVAIKDMAYDHSTGTMYAISMNKLYQVDLVTGALTQLTTTTNFGLSRMAYTLCCTTDGQLYLGTMDNRLAKLDKTTGLGSYVNATATVKLDGASSMNASNNSFTYDHANKTFYWSAITATKGLTCSVLNTVDVTTGQIRANVGSFASKEGANRKINSLFTTYTDTLYGYNLATKQWVSLQTADPTELTVLADGADIVCADSAGNGKVYGYLKGGKQLFCMDLAKGDYSYVNVGAASTVAMRDMAYDRQTGTMYAIPTLGNKLYQVNLTTGVVTQVGTVANFGVSGMMGYMLGCTTDGQLYIGTSLGRLAKLDKTTGLGSYINTDATVKMDGNSAMVAGNCFAFDHNTGRMYWGAITAKYGTTTSALNQVNLGTGLVEKYAGVIGGTQTKQKICGIFAL